MKKFFSKNWFIIAVSAIAVAQIFNMAISIRNARIIKRNNELRQQVELVKERTNEIISNTIHGIDLGVRGYALTKENGLLDPYIKVSKTNVATFNELETLLRQQGYDDLDKFYALRKEVDDYFEFTAQMIELVRQDRMAEFTEMLKVDRGYNVWLKFSAFQQPLNEFENRLYSEAAQRYESAMQMNTYLQVSIVLFSIPVLFLVLVRIQKERNGRRALLHQVEDNDRNYVFNSGVKKDLSADEIIRISIENTRKASDFVKSMANSNYDVEWDGLDDQNVDLNKHTLAGDLINMREQLRKVKADDERRNWVNEGLAKFSELVRNNQHDSQLLSDKCVSFLTKYLNGQQASLFVVAGEGETRCLQLTSCFAFDKKKWVEKQIDPGNGLVGQAFMEGETIKLRQLPKGYTSITSGLGDATPDFLVIVPLKYDVQTVAVFEIAAFHEFDDHHIQFLQKAGEFLASAILNSQNTQRMKVLLENARINEEQMRQREEEMRQNMEELQATQEELVRKEHEMQKHLLRAGLTDRAY